MHTRTKPPWVQQPALLSLPAIALPFPLGCQHLGLSPGLKGLLHPVCRKTASDVCRSNTLHHVSRCHGMCVCRIHAVADPVKHCNSATSVCDICSTVYLQNTSFSAAAAIQKKSVKAGTLNVRSKVVSKLHSWLQTLHLRQAKQR